MNDPPRGWLRKPGVIESIPQADMAKAVLGAVKAKIEPEGMWDYLEGYLWHDHGRRLSNVLQNLRRRTDAARNAYDEAARSKP